MNNNMFCFFPVGHGLFYTGIIPNLNVKFVYDCGTMTNGVSIDSHIHYFASICKDDHLDFLAISHFHKDHYSGVQKLLNIFNCDEIFYPYICGNKDVRLSIIAVIMSNSGYSNKAILRTIELVEQKGNVEWKLSERTEDGTVLASYKCNYNQWNFLFFSKSISSTQESAFLNQINLHIHKQKCANALELIEKHIDIVTKIYKGIFGANNLNYTSLCMLHYPVDYKKYCFARFNPMPFRCCSFEVFHPVSLLTGDCVFDKVMANTVLNEVQKDIGIIQVPHHGSNSNWTALDKNLQRNNSFYVISKGITQKVSNLHTTIKDLTKYKFTVSDEKHAFVYWVF